MLAEAILNDKTQSPTAYLNGDGSLINSLSQNEIACLMTYNNTGQWQAVLDALSLAVANNDKSKLGSYITTTSTGFSISEYTGISYVNNDTINETSPSNGYICPSHFSDIEERLAYDVYNLNPSKYTGMTPNQLTGRIQSLFSGAEAASISTFYGTPEWNIIVNQIANKLDGLGEIDSRYKNQFNGYSVTYNTEDRVHITSEVVGATDPVMGTVHMADVETIKSNLEFALKHAGSSKTAEQIVTGKSDAQLYMINEIVCEYLSSGGENSSRFTAMIGGDIPASPYSTSEYNYSKDISGTCKATKYAEKVVDQKEVWRKDDNYYRLVNEYNLQQKFKGLKVKIIEEPLASSVDFVSNFLTFDNAYIVEFDKNKQEIYDTSVATNTNLQEVSDEKDLKKAEAKYEADMKRIDMKDRRYDTELAALDNERNAVKLEMETVKTVAKDNVDRTFRLFS